MEGVSEVKGDKSKRESTVCTVSCTSSDDVDTLLLCTRLLPSSLALSAALWLSGDSTNLLYALEVL